MYFILIFFSYLALILNTTIYIKHKDKLHKRLLLFPNRIALALLCLCIIWLGLNNNIDYKYNCNYQGSKPIGQVVAGTTSIGFQIY